MRGGGGGEGALLKEIQGSMCAALSEEDPQVTKNIDMTLKKLAHLQHLHQHVV